MAENGCRIGNMEIPVRTLTGESTVVHIPSNKTVHDLKLLLKLSFAPASFTPNFHLFYKGVKLSLQSTVSSFSIGHADFLVMIPFVKKERPQTKTPDFSESSSISNFADSAYSDMMQDFMSSREEETREGEEGRGKEEPCSPHPFEMKRKRGVDCYDQEGHKYDFVRSVLQSPNKDVFEGQNSEKLVEVLESVNCLSSLRSAKCMLLREANMHRSYGEVFENNDKKCCCPAWLKKILEAFSFLSLFSAFHELRGKTIKLSGLKEALLKLGGRVSFEDMKHLSVICPKMVRFADDITEAMNFSAALVIFDSPVEEVDEIEGHHRTGQKLMSLSKISNAMKKRDNSFKSNLWKIIKLYKNDNERNMLFSLENLLLFVKESGAVLGGTEVKRAKSSTGAVSSSQSAQNRCSDTNQLLPLEMVEHLRNGVGSKGQIVHVEDIDARESTYAEIPTRLSDKTIASLESIGINKLYIHQAESIMASLRRRNVAVATATSSGKSLCYNVPVVEELSQNFSSCALYLFPTKALAQDQLRALLVMTKQFDAHISIGVYDGDTSQNDRMWLRDNARVLITNPDMLHMSILPSHRQFTRILSNIRYVVIDEAHAYKGAFGCHTALILRRLRRLCSHVYGSDPSFVFCTATSANPREHCMNKRRLLGSEDATPPSNSQTTEERPFKNSKRHRHLVRKPNYLTELANLSELELIVNDGSPSSRKLFVLWNPSCQRTMLDKAQNDMDTNNVARTLSSPIVEISNIFAEIVQHGLRCIAFCRSRKLCELVLCYTREILEKTAPHLVDSICAYRGGYVAEDRRRIENDLFGGKLCGIAATNALELGIDVGHIDVTLHLGFPGSIASLRQQAGRSGRREKPSLAVYVAFESPLDQYFMNFPKKLFGSSIECCHIDAKNPQVLEQHLICAAFEHPLSLQHDEKYFGSGLSSAITNLKNKGDLSFDPSRDSSSRIWSYIGHEKVPSRVISIRAIEGVRYKVIDMRRDEVIEEIEESKAFFQIYEGAVYMHQGRTYLVKDLNIESKTALCQEASVEYYTKTRDYTDIHVIGSNIAYPVMVSRTQLPRTRAQAHACKVTTTWFGFHRVRKGTNEVFDTVELSLPKFSYESQAVWIQVPQSTKTEVEKKYSFRAGFHAASHALLHVVPLYIRCNYSDLAPECPNPHETRYFPERILLYDKHPGGTGVSMQIQPYFNDLLKAALELLTSCRCSAETGCPNCVQNLACGEYNELIHKDAAIMIIQGVLDAEKSYFGESPTHEQVDILSGS